MCARRAGLAEIQGTPQHLSALTDFQSVIVGRLEPDRRSGSAVAEAGAYAIKQCTQAFDKYLLV